MTPSRFRWGTLLILVGVLLLLKNMDVLNNNFWTDFVIYFPILLICIGIEKIFTKSKVQFISYLTSVVLFAGGIYLALAGSRGGDSDSFFSETTYSQAADPSVKTIHAVLDLGHGSLTVRDAGDDIVNARFKEFSEKPEVKYAVTGGEANVSFTDKRSEMLWGLVKIDGGDPNDWYLSFSSLVPLILECRGSGSDIHLNLATTPVKQVKVNADQATIYLKLGISESDVDVNLGGKDSDIRLRVPTSSGLKVTGTNDEEYLSQVGLKRRGDAFESDGYDTLNSHIVVNLDDRASSLSIDYY
jgi:hypothetical protein